MKRRRNEKEGFTDAQNEAHPKKEIKLKYLLGKDEQDGSIITSRACALKAQFLLQMMNKGIKNLRCNCSASLS